jgi:hypothetical protein
VRRLDWYRFVIALEEGADMVVEQEQTLAVVVVVDV